MIDGNRKNWDITQSKEFCRLPSTFFYCIPYERAVMSMDSEVTESLRLVDASPTGAAEDNLLLDFDQINNILDGFKGRVNRDLPDLQSDSSSDDDDVN